MKLLSASLIAFLMLAPAQEKRSPVPDEAALTDAEKTVRDVFKGEYAKKTPADKRLLARRLLAQGKESGGVLPSQYVLCSQALDLAIQAADVETALAAMGELTKTFSVDAGALKLSSLAALAKALKTPEDIKAVSNAYLQFADEAMKADDLDNASKAAGEAGAQARRAKELPLAAAAAESKSKEIAIRKVRFEKVRKAKEVLATMPDDPAANVVVGQYLCFKGDWEGALACLAKGPDGPLKAAAQKDAANPQAPEEMATAGDGWWEVSETSPPEDKAGLRDRAGRWYELSFAKLSGLARVKVEKRLRQWNEEKLARGSWVDYTDPNQFGLKGKPGDPIEIVHLNKGTLTPVATKGLPPGEFNGLSVRVRLKMKERYFSVSTMAPGYPHGLGFILSDNGTRINMPGENVPLAPVQILPVTVGDEFVVTILCSNGRNIVYINYLEIGQFPNPVGYFDSLTMMCALGTTTLDKIRMKKRG
jgi:hypothetical protein